MRTPHRRYGERAGPHGAGGRHGGDPGEHQEKARELSGGGTNSRATGWSSAARLARHLQ
ncbi:hypothetical protein IPZ61_04965 [Streptomyces sioyaensis]|uniref:hypothetical protein n=1 Tax=Streptomyces sioyaensis TaxID=67364 RepID=UPI001F262E4A|nr:hypothetical protein [Streptomyces sioyaensis]MCF3172667.1 hypothetical protein [Streptomyces sioyaensis]